jgi:sugar lactone lactonase YvrE
MHPIYTRRTRNYLATIALVTLAVGSIHAQTPVAVFSQANGFLSGSTGVPSVTGGGYGGTVATRVSANSRGDVIAAVSSGCGNGSTYILEAPVKSGTTVNLLTGMGCPYGGPSAYVDSHDNIYVADTADATILYIPLVNGAYPTNAAFSSLSNCSAFPVPATQTATCKVPLNYPSTLGYYIQVGDLGMDGAGNLYLLDKYTGGNFYGGVDVLIRVNAADGSFSLLNTTLGNDAFATIAVDKAGNVLIKDNGSVNLYPVTDYTTGQGVFYLNNPQGTSVDSGGNFYISDQTSSGNNFIEIPAASIAANNVNQNFFVTNQIGTYFGSQSSQALGIDGFGEIYYAGGYPNSISYVIAGKLNFGSQTVGSGAGGSQTLNIVFNAAVSATPSFNIQPTGAFAVTGNTCTGGSYAVAANCSVSVTYSATANGAQNATLQILSGTTVLGTATLSGFGVAPLINVDPGIVVTDGVGYTAPSAVAVDASGNLFVADQSTGNIYKTTTGSTSAATAVASGFTAPSAIAVDGSGNLYVADSGSLFEVPYNGTSYAAATTLYTGLTGTTGIALDAAGDLYVADSGNARVLRLSYSDGLPLGSIVTPFGTGFTSPVAIAIDNNSNNVYVADSGSKSVVQVGIYTLLQANVVSGLNVPSGLATDAAGTLYVVDSGAATVTRVPNVGGAINNNQATALATVKLPTAIATDSTGNLYVVDTTDQAVATDTRSTGALNFGYVNETQTSSVVSAQISNGGTAAIALNTPYFTQAGTPTGAISSFAIQASSTCASGQSINQGASCVVAADFAPLATGQLTDTLSFSSNANAATLTLSGFGTNLAKTTTTLSVTSPAPPAQPAFGQPVTVKATVAPASGTGTPSGTVTFYLDNVAQLTTPTLSNGSASFTFTGLLGGQHTINASYSGDTINYASSNTNANPLIITVGTTTSTTSVTLSGSPALFTNPTSAYPGQSVTLTALITPGAPGIPTGSVFFFNGTTQINTTAATVIPVTINGVSYGQATYTTTTLAAGQYSITAQYSGDSNYGGSTSSPGVPLLISVPTIALTSGSSTIGAGAGVTLTLSSIAGYSGAVDLACLGLPAYATCSFSPAVAITAPTAPAVINMQVFVNQPPPIAPGNASLMPVGGGVMLAALLLWPFALLSCKRKLGHSLLSLLLLCGLAASLTGCGGNGTKAGYVTPQGKYPITVTATIGPATLPGTPVVAATLPLTLTVN